MSSSTSHVRVVEQPGDENLVTVTVTVTGDDKMLFLFDFKLTPQQGKKLCLQGPSRRFRIYLLGFSEE